MSLIERIIISGGGTGGHIFPGISIADEVRSRSVNAEILFVGAEGKMEMDKVPAAGYQIVGLPVRGLQRSLTWRNFNVPLKLLSSFWKAHSIVRSFRPQCVVGVGGYASFPVLAVAAFLRVPMVIQEQNALPGLANRILARWAQKICVAYNGLERFFDTRKIVLTGNPVRRNLLEIPKEDPYAHFGLEPNLPVVLLFGGSLGAHTINQAVVGAAAMIAGRSDIQWLWQIGATNFARYESSSLAGVQHVKMLPFIDRMDLAYACATLVVCRAGALTVAEICVLGKPAILVPSPYVADDHQSKNAKALEHSRAAVVISDAQATEVLMDHILDLLADEDRLRDLGRHAARLGTSSATRDIVDVVEEILTKNYGRK